MGQHGFCHRISRMVVGDGPVVKHEYKNDHGVTERFCCRHYGRGLITEVYAPVGPALYYSAALGWQDAQPKKDDDAAPWIMKGKIL